MTDYAAIVLMKKYKSLGTGLLLTGLLGSIGLFYSSVIGGLIMFLIEFISGYLYFEYIIDAYNKFYLPEYHLREFILFLIVLRIISFIITYSSIKQHNGSLDKKLRELSETLEERNHQKEITKQLENAEEYINSNSKKSIRTGTIVVVMSFTVIMGIILTLNYYTGRNELSTTIEQPQPLDIENHNTYIVKHDSAWIYSDPNENENSGRYFIKNMIFYAIKERNGFIYVSGNDSEANKVVYGWLKKADMEDLSGCLH